MKLLTMLDSVVVTSAQGIARRRKQALFECPVCLKAVQKEYSNGLKTETCGKGCKDNGCTTHSHSGTPLYICWNNIRLRCDKPSNKAYKYYGAKGISYPAEWNTFEGFFKDMGMSYREGLTIDRKDKDKDYSKANCRWVSFDVNRTKDRIKTVNQYTMDGVFVASFPSTAEAGRKTGIRNQSIARAARGDRPHGEGYIWRYV